MAQDKSHTTHDLAEMEQFPPTVVDHTVRASGTELEMLDSGDGEDRRFIWIPNDPDTEPIVQV